MEFKTKDLAVKVLDIGDRKVRLALQFENCVGCTNTGCKDTTDALIGCKSAEDALIEVLSSQLHAIEELLERFGQAEAPMGATAQDQQPSPQAKFEIEALAAHLKAVTKND